MDDISFYQVSNKVGAHVIKAATSKCDREDCCISARIGETTTAATSEYYDKNGILHVKDPNRFTAKLCCKSCWKGWTVDNEGNVL